VEKFYNSTLLKHFLIILLCLVGIVFVEDHAVFAQAEVESESTDTVTDTNTNTQYIPDTYNFSVVETNNMSLLVRRAIQLYDQAQPDIELSQAQVIYAETKTIKLIKASDLIYPGDKVEIDSSTLEGYALSSQDLSETSLKAWQVYADNASFDLGNIKADNVTHDDSGKVVPAPTQSSDSNDEELPPLTDLTKPQTDTNDNTNSSWAWWFIGGGTVALLWYSLWRRQEV
jgi:hypothetical protein